MAFKTKPVCEELRVPERVENCINMCYVINVYRTCNSFTIRSNFFKAECCTSSSYILRNNVYYDLRQGIMAYETKCKLNYLIYISHIIIFGWIKILESRNQKVALNFIIKLYIKGT